jgi:hypothetical protein
MNRGGRDGSAARETARALVHDLREVVGAALGPREIDLGPAIEQVLFHAVRGGLEGAADSGPPRQVRAVRAFVDALRPARARVQRCDVLAVLLTGVHDRLFEPVSAELARRAPDLVIATVTAGRASRDLRLSSRPSTSREPRWADLPSLLRVGFEERRARRVLSSWRRLLGEDDADTALRVAANAAARLAVEALRLDATLRAARPRVAVTYDEIDAWGRLLCAVAARRDVRVVDLPHAEAVDVEAIRGVGYDAIGAYGPRAAGVITAAGVPPKRIRVVGPARFDRLVAMATQPVDDPVRVLLAGQYRGRAMTDELRAGILAAAVAAAASVRGAVEVLPHPTEGPEAWEALVERMHAPGPAVRVVDGAGLHDRLPGAGLLVTGWSNSVYESVLAGVPAMTVHPGPGDPPMPFAREGLATEVRDATEAFTLAPRLVAEPGRSAAIERARPALVDHLGPLDGRATERSAELVAIAAGA